MPCAIYEFATTASAIPNGFDTVHLILDAGVKADLDWNKTKESARDFIARGYRLFWELDLGLFDRLPHSLAHQSQFLSLVLSIDHFREDIWKEFEAHSLGVCIYRGCADFSRHFPWDDQQRVNFSDWLTESGFKDRPVELPRLTTLYCRNAATDYLKLLAGHLPDAIAKHVMLDAGGISDLELLAHLLSSACYFPLYRMIKNLPFILSDTMSWGSGGSHIGFIGRDLNNAVQPLPVAIGVCIPPASHVTSEATEGLSQALSSLNAGEIPFKIIAEENLVSEWDGLDTLIVCSKGVTASGLRKLKGFCAAGGQIATLGPLLDLPIEISFGDAHLMTS